MTLEERLQTDMKQAMRDKNEVARDTLRMVLAELRKKEAELGKALSPDDETAVLIRAAKTRQDSVEQYGKAGRMDLVAREQSEIAVVQSYLPKALSESDTKAAVTAVMAELGLSSKKDMGTVMKAVMARHKGQVDGKAVQKILGEVLK
jgi:uncharacterized protein YqeY